MKTQQTAYFGEIVTAMVQRCFPSLGRPVRQRGQSNLFMGLGKLSNERSAQEPQLGTVER